MTVQTTRGGFTLLEMLVASLLLSMLVVALSMVFSSSASAWRIGTAGVDGLEKVRKNLSGYHLAADNALPYLRGVTKSDVGYVRSVWLNRGGSLVDVNGDSVKVARGFDTDVARVFGDGRYKADAKPYAKIGSGNIGKASGNQVHNYMVGVGSAGPDRQWGTKDDIATWPSDPGGGI